MTATRAVEGPWTYGSLTVTCDRVLEPAVTATLWPLYRTAFSPLQTLAAARQLLTEDEFSTEMADLRIWKYVAWSDGHPVGLSTGTDDLDSIPWVSAEFYRDRYPEAADRGALLYLGFSLVHPDHRDQRVYLAMLRALLSRPAALGAVVGWDICGYNDAERLFGVGLARVVQRLTGANVDTVDVQTYYAAQFPIAVPVPDVENE